MTQHFPHPDGLPAPNGYSHTVAAAGRLVVVSGQLPVDAHGVLVAPDASAQAARVFANVAVALAAAGAAAHHVIRFGFFLTDLSDIGAVREARDAFLGDAPPPASSLVQVSGLVVPGARIEIDALAVTER